MKTQGEIEAAVCQGINRFSRNTWAGDPRTSHFLDRDLLVARLRGVLTAAEQHLVKSLPGEKGRDLLKQVRTQLIETARPGIGGDDPGDYRGPSIEPPPRCQHGHRRGGRDLHSGRVTPLSRIKKEIDQPEAPGLWRYTVPTGTRHGSPASGDIFRWRSEAAAAQFTCSVPAGCRYCLGRGVRRNQVISLGADAGKVAHSSGMLAPGDSAFDRNQDRAPDSSVGCAFLTRRFHFTRPRRAYRGGRRFGRTRR